MPKTRFIRKACTLDEVRERTQWLERYCGEQPLDRYYVAKEIQLQENDFFEPVSYTHLDVYKRQA